MKIIITVVILCAAAICAPAAEKPKKKEEGSPQPRRRVTIPKDAVPNADGVSYIYTDKQGKKWTYTKTPFGVMKTPGLRTAQSSLARTGLEFDKGNRQGRHRKV